MTGATDTPSLGDNAAPESPLPGVREIFRRPLPHQAGRPLTRFFIKSFLSLFRSRYLALEGFEHIGVDCDPFILAANHSQRPEAVLVPAAVFFHRKGKPVHFMADWNLKLIPGIALVYSCGQIITVDRKPAKPAFLNVFRPMLTDKVSAPKRAQERLEAGSPVAIFPEGTVNRSTDTLLKGHPGAAQLSMKTGVPVVPMGIRFPAVPSGRPIRDRDRMSLHIGPPMSPPSRQEGSGRGALRKWHLAIMKEISRLSGKKMEC